MTIRSGSASAATTARGRTSSIWRVSTSRRSTPWRVEGGLDWDFGSSAQPVAAYTVMNFGPGDVRLVLDGVDVVAGNEGENATNALRPHGSIVVTGRELSVQLVSGGGGYAEGLVKVEPSP